MRRAILPVLVLLLAGYAGTLGVHAAENQAADQAAENRAAWDEKALTRLASLAADVSAAGLGCGDFEPYTFAPIAHDYRKRRIPLPTAMGACENSDEESLEFAAFEDAEAKSRFINEKRELLCRRSKERELGFPGFPYVDGGTWTVQPDANGTSQKLARVLNAAPARADCPK